MILFRIIPTASRFFYVSNKMRGYMRDMSILAPSTLLTSIWAILILVPTAILKLLAPLHRFTAWFFDVDRHPVRTIGIVSAAWVMIGSLLWAMLRAII
jgi:hypothetical protein